MSEDNKKSAVQVILHEIHHLQEVVTRLDKKVDFLTDRNEHRIIRCESLLKAILGLENVPNLSKMVSGKSETPAKLSEEDTEIKMGELII